MVQYFNPLYSNLTPRGSRIKVKNTTWDHRQLYFSPFTKYLLFLNYR
jgi:hypothetical protein